MDLKKKNCFILKYGTFFFLYCPNIPNHQLQLTDRWIQSSKCWLVLAGTFRNIARGFNKQYVWIVKSISIPLNVSDPLALTGCTPNCLNTQLLERQIDHKSFFMRSCLLLKYIVGGFHINNIFITLHTADCTLNAELPEWVFHLSTVT